MLFWAMPAIVLTIVLRAQLVRVILGSGEFNWDATRLTAAALALFVISLAAQSITLLIARAYYAAGRTKMPLIFGLLSVVVTIGSAFFLVFLFHASPLVRYFLEDLFRVSGLTGTSVLMLALAYTLGAAAQCGLGMLYFARDFGVSYAGLKRLLFQSFSASVLGGAAAYGMLTITGALVDINTTIGIVAQGILGGMTGVVATVFVLLILKNQELSEAIDALGRRFRDAPGIALEPTDVSS